MARRGAPWRPTPKQLIIVTGILVYTAVFAWCYWVLAAAAGGWDA